MFFEDKSRFAKKSEFLKKKYLQCQEQLTPEQEVELASIPDTEMVCYAFDNCDNMYIKYEFSLEYKKAEKKRRFNYHGKRKAV